MKLFQRLLKLKSRQDLKSGDSDVSSASRRKHVTPKPAPMTPQEQDELDGLLQAALPDEIPNTATELDGFLTCLIVGPSAAPEEWFSFLFHGKPPFEDPKRTDRLLELIGRRHHHIAFDFARPKPHFQPLFVGFSFAKTAAPLGKTIGTIQDWCAGFMIGIDIHPRPWRRRLNKSDPFSPLYLPWLLGTEEGRQKQWQDAVEWYRDEGYQGEEAEHMALRWYTLPGTRRRAVSDLKKSILTLHADFRR